MSRSWTTFVKKNSWNSLQNKPAILSDDQISFSEIINKPTTLSGYGITDAQPLGNELTAIQALADTTGFLRKTGDGSYSIDPNSYLPLTGGAVFGTFRANNNFENGTSGMTIQSRATGTAQGQLAGYSFLPTFMNTPGDSNPRRAADIWAGFNNGNWGTQYLSFGVGSPSSNDAANTTTERMRITATGNVGIGTTAPNLSAILDLSSSNKGFLPPRLSSAQRDAITSPVAGLIIYNSSVNKHQTYNGTTWIDFY